MDQRRCWDPIPIDNHIKSTWGDLVIADKATKNFKITPILKLKNYLNIRYNSIP